MQMLFEHRVALDRDLVFAFHENPANLEHIMAGWRPFRLLHHAGSIAPGCETWVEENTLAFIPVVLGYRHNLYQPPHRFGEELVHGPFSRFSHVHEFEDDGRGGTIVRDRLDVRLPWQYGGRMAMERIAAPRIRHAFSVRGRNLQRLAADGTIVRVLDDRYSRNEPPRATEDVKVVCSSSFDLDAESSERRLE